MSTLKGKKIALGVTGGIAAYKALYLLRLFVEAGAKVHVVMTDHSTEFVAPLSFAVLSAAPVAFGENADISAALGCDLFVVAPATANIIAKYACGIADETLSRALAEFRGPLLFAPAMNTHMYENPVTQHNLKLLRKLGADVLEPDEGMLACGDSGRGKLPEPEEIADRALYLLSKHDLDGKRVVVTAGPTRESLDPVRFVSNHSTGKMGYELARSAYHRGAQVTLVSGATALPRPYGVERVDVLSAADMFSAVQGVFDACDIYVSAAAVADYTPVSVADQKIKKAEGGLSVPLERTVDILAWCGQHRREGQRIVGFAMETQDLIENAQKKLTKKNADMIVANSLRTEGAGFGGDTNVVTLITAGGNTELPLLSKYDTADAIFNALLKL